MSAYPLRPIDNQSTSSQGVVSQFDCRYPHRYPAIGPATREEHPGDTDSTGRIGGIVDA